MDIMLCYIIIRYAVAVALVISSVIFFIKTIKQHNLAFLVGIIMPLLVVVWMFLYGAVRKPAIDIEDVCINFDALYEEAETFEIKDERMYVYSYILEQEYASHNIWAMTNEYGDELITGNYNDVEYYATPMYSDMKIPENMRTYHGTCYGHVLFVKDARAFCVRYNIYTNPEDPRAIFYSFAPDADIKVSDYLN